ncbi:MAG: hypothetical protein IJF71_02395 [Clostridia bacterium]|nr:hypothetical protein [Clostridia bacterium]
MEWECRRIKGAKKGKKEGRGMLLFSIDFIDNNYSFLIGEGRGGKSVKIYRFLQNSPLFACKNSFYLV